MKAFFIISNLIDAIVWSIVEKVLKLWQAAIKFSVCRVIESLSEKAFHKIALEITDEAIQQKILETFKSAQIERQAQYVEEMIEEISQLLHSNSNNGNHPNKPKQHTSTNAQILQMLSLYDQIFTRYPKMMHIPLTMFHYLLEIPSADSRAALLAEINRSILSEDELAYIIAIVKEHEMSKLTASMNADQKHSTTFTRHEFIDKLCKALEFGTDLHLMPMSESFTSADKEFVLKLFVVLIPPFGEKGSEKGEKSKLFNFLNELELVKNPKIWDTYRAIILEHLKVCEHKVILAKARSKDPMSVVQQTFENIRHHISLLENLNKHSHNDKTVDVEYKIDLYKSLAKLPLSV